MADRSQIQPGMEVIASDGTFVGRVQAVEGSAIRLTPKDSPDLLHRLVPLAWVDRVDRHVHLTIAREGLAGLKDGSAATSPLAAPPAGGTLPPVAGAAGAAIGAVGAAAAGHVEPLGGASRPAAPAPSQPRPQPAAPADPARAKSAGGDEAASPLPPIRNPAVKGARPRSNYYLPWVLGLLVAMLLLFGLVRSCDTSNTDTQRAETSNSAPATSEAAPAASNDRPVQLVTGLTTGTVAYDLNTRLASGEAGERTFTFDNLNFNSGSARLRREDREDIGDIARVLAAYPAARIAVVGYTDARGGGEGNARLGFDRANAVVGELADQGVAPNRMEARSGGEAAPVAPNEQAEGQAENRRTELILLAQ